MNAALMTREERVARLADLRAREAARKVVLRGKPLMELPLDQRIAFALFDPGAIVPRGDNHTEPVYRWQARAVTYVLPDETAAAVAAQGALPVPAEVKPLAPQGRPRTMLDRARDALNARMTKDDLRLVLENVITHADALKDRVAELEAERHTTNEALTDAAEALRANRDRIAELEENLRAVNAGWSVARGRIAEVRTEALAEAKDEVVEWLVKKAHEGTEVSRLADKVERGAIRIFFDAERSAAAPVQQHYDKVPDPQDGCHWCACGNRWPCKHAKEAAS